MFEFGFWHKVRLLFFDFCLTSGCQMLMFGTTKYYRGQTGWFTVLGFSFSGLSETNVRTMKGKTK